MSARYHVQSALEKTVGKHYLAASVAIGVLTLLSIILILVLMKCKKAAKGKMTISPCANNMNTGNNNSQWFHGGVDAGEGGSVDRDTTPYHRALWNRAHRSRQACGGVMSMRRERMATGGCEDGEVAVTYAGPDGRPMTYCRPADGGLPATCGGEWDSSATSEAMALATAGSYPHEPLAEDRLISAIGAGHGAPLSDHHLEKVMHEGGS